MRTNQAGIDLIKRFEGFRASPYQCPAGVWTIGYGSTTTPAGKPITKASANISKRTASEWMGWHLQGNEHEVASLITAPLNENQHGAMMSFIYNLGAAQLESSTLRMKLNRQEYASASREFKRWKYASGRVVKGLVLRRLAEKELFLRGVAHPHSCNQP